MSLERERFELKVGIFVFVGIVALGALVMVLGSKQEMFARQYPLFTEFEKVGGLKLGAPVRLSGVDVGIVDSISFPETPGSRKLKVRLLVRASVRNRIRQDSVASLSSQGVLGDKYISISLGTQGEPVKRGATIPSEKPADYVALADSAGELLQKLTSIAGRVDAAMATGSGGDAVKSLGGALASVQDIFEEIKTGDGLIHQLVYDEKAGQVLRDMQTASANLAAITNELRSGEGALPHLMNDPKTKESLVKAMNAMANMEKATADASSAAADLKAVMNRIERGEGTLGALINDPAVYDDLSALLGRAKRNRVLRGVIRHTIEKNEKVEEVEDATTTVPMKAPKSKETPAP